MCIRHPTAIRVVKLFSYITSSLFSIDHIYRWIVTLRHSVATNTQIQKRWIKDECLILDEITSGDGAMYERSTDENILVHCNIIHSSTMRGKQAPVIYSLFPNAASGQKILEPPQNLPPNSSGYIERCYWNR